MPSCPPPSRAELPSSLPASIEMSGVDKKSVGNDDKHIQESVTKKTCCGACAGWICRNAGHTLLFVLAIGAVGGVLIGSLRPCDSKFVNQTVTSTQPQTVNVSFLSKMHALTATRLDVVHLLDTSGSMKCCPSKEWTQSSGVCDRSAALPASAFMDTTAAYGLAQQVALTQKNYAASGRVPGGVPTGQELDVGHSGCQAGVTYQPYTLYGRSLTLKCCSADSTKFCVDNPLSCPSGDCDLNAGGTDAINPNRCEKLLLGGVSIPTFCCPATGGYPSTELCYPNPQYEDGCSHHAACMYNATTAEPVDWATCMTDSKVFRENVPESMGKSIFCCPTESGMPSTTYCSFASFIYNNKTTYPHSCDCGCSGDSLYTQAKAAMPELNRALSAEMDRNTLGCSAPDSEWCTSPFLEVLQADCDDDGIFDLLCRQMHATDGSFLSVLLSSNDDGSGNCAVEPAVTTCAPKCPRPADFCTAVGDQFEIKDCDKDGKPDLVCYSIFENSTSVIGSSTPGCALMSTSDGSYSGVCESAMAKTPDGGLNKTWGTLFKSGFALWSSQITGSTASIYSDTAEVNGVFTNMTKTVAPLGSTYWGLALCRCYNLLQSNTDASPSKEMCVLISDGVNIDKDLDYNTGKDVGAGAEVPAQTRLVEECASIRAERGAGTPLKYTDIASFLKSKDISVFGMLVGSVAKNANADSLMHSISDCDDTFGDNNCIFFSYFNDFAELRSRAKSIASMLRGTLTREVTTETSSSREIATEKIVSKFVEGKISICDNSFLWSLLAFVPLLLYLLYRPVSMLINKTAIKHTLEVLMNAGEIRREDGQMAEQATKWLLPGNMPGDIDWGITVAMFRCCSCLLPLSDRDLDSYFDNLGKKKDVAESMAF